MKIVVVEDNPALNKLMTSILTSKGYEVYSVFDGSEALEVINKNVPDVVFLDILLPNVDGRDICKNIKSNPDTANSWVIVISAKDSDLDKDVYFELGADDFVAKPVLRNDILRLLKRLKRRFMDNDNQNI